MLRYVVPLSLAAALLPAAGCRTTDDSGIKSDPVSSGTYGTDDVFCRVGNTRLSYKLSFDWSQDKVDISSNTGPTDGYELLFKQSTAVRNNAQDGSFLAEGIAAESTVKWDEACGGLLTSLYFDVTERDGALTGTVTQTPRWTKNPAAPVDLVCFYPMIALAPETHEVSCVRETSSVEPGNECPAGQSLVTMPPDQNGCAREPKCVDWSTCPQLSQPPPGWCSDGYVVPGGVDDRGCTKAPICSRPDMCPQWAPPPPNWCADGDIVPAGVDQNGCQRPPHCVTADTCPGDQGGGIACALEIALVCEDGLVDGCLNGSTKTHRCVEKEVCEKFVMAQTMIHKTNKDCQLAGDGCDVRSLQAQGYEPLATGQKCANVDNRLCAKVMTQMIHGTTGKCVVAGDSCQASDLEQEGFRRKGANDKCAREPRRNCGLLFVSELMYNKSTKACASAATTCVVEDLKKQGYAKARAGQCQQGGEPGGLSCAAEIALACEMPYVDGCTLEAPYTTKEHKCVQPPARTCPLFIRAEPMFNPKTQECALAGDGCAVADLSKKGYRGAKSGECGEL
jgi:hypothetical protein